MKAVHGQTRLVNNSTKANEHMKAQLNFILSLSSFTRIITLGLLFFGATNTHLAQLPEHVSAQGLIGWYALQNGTEDQSMYNRHAQVVGATPAPDRFNNPNSAYYFDGQNSLLSIEHHALHNSVPLTISLWMKPNELVGGGPLISKGLDGFQNTWLIETLRGGDNDDAIMPSYMIQTADMNDPCECGCCGIMEGQGDCGVGMNYDGNIFDGSWHLVTFVVSELGGKLYVDGTLVSSQNWAGNNALISNTSEILIGALRHVNGPWEFFKGFIDDIGIWNRALNDAEVLALYNEDPLPIPCNMFDTPTYENIVGHWPFCGNADDESPNGFHGTIEGAELTADALGNAESAYHFDSTSIDLPLEVNWLNSDFTIHLESRMLEFADDYPTIVSCAGLVIQYATTCSPYCLNVYLRGDGYEFAHVAIPIEYDQWNTITLKREGQLLILYLNGIAWNWADIDPNATALNDTHMTLGYNGNILVGYEGELDNVAMWTRSLTEDEIWEISNASGFIIAGCTDPSACNYEPLATVDDWGCGYLDWPCNDGNPNTINDTYNSICDCEGMWGEWQEGCTNPSACNFDWLAVVDDGSCHYPWSPCDDGDSATTNTYLNWWCECVEEVICNDPWAINFFPNSTSTEDCEYAAEIYTFEDYNSNGAWDYNEPALGNWPLAIFGSDGLTYTDAYGYTWVVTNPINGELVASDSIYTDWHSTTPLVISTDWGWPAGVWGFVNANPEGVSANISQHLGWPPIIHCDSGLDVGAYISNSGTEPINAVVTITCSDTLPYSANTTPAIVAISADTVVINHISSYNFELASFHIDSPGMEFLDNFFAITICVAVFDSAGNAVSDTCFVYGTVVACSYDPNDLTANSPGHYEPHFISAGERVMFRVRFQNTGNYQAEDVLIRDLLDPQVWDISTFETAMASVGGIAYDGMQSDLNPLTGEVSFLFDGIHLPDSSMSQELSQGFVTFYVNIRDGLTHGTELNNTAEIYFDNNPAIVTNTTSHAIFDCNTLTGINGDTQICAGEMLELVATQEYVDAYSWNVNEISASSSVLTTELLPQGEFAVTLQLENPLCIVSHESTVVVSAVPDNSIFTEGTTLWVESGNQWQWFFDGEPLEGATAQTITVEAEGTYSVLISSNANCEAEGTFRFIPNTISEEFDEVLSLWPNPMQSECRIQLPDAPCSLSLYDASGRLVKQEQLKGEQHLMKRGTLECGLYQLIIKTPTSTHWQKLIIE